MFLLELKQFKPAHLSVRLQVPTRGCAFWGNAGPQLRDSGSVIEKLLATTEVGVSVELGMGSLIVEDKLTTFE